MLPILPFIALLSAPLVETPPIVVPGGPGHFDFMNIDAKNRLVFACHPGKSSFAVVDLSNDQVKDVEMGVECNGIGVDSAGHRVFAAGPGKTLVCVDTKTWTKKSTLDLGGPGDCVQFDSKRGLVYVDNDDGTNLWIVNPSGMKLVGSVTIKEAPEYMEYDPGRDRIFQAIKSTNTVQVIDPNSRKVLDEWKLGDLTSPHGLAVDRKLGRVFVAGKNGKLVVLDAATGKLLRTMDIVRGSDQIAYDGSLHRLYIPSQGKIQVIGVSKESETLVGEVDVNADCHRVAIDPQSHDVWVAYSDKSNSYVQKFQAK
ncbi:MAG TPA: hypothetical protein VHE55_10440 [Fimbriimonadaceae bacterium]|nr:hypothetical protein [Fimbriimonadaceae bacterium]